MASNLDALIQKRGPYILEKLEDCLSEAVIEKPSDFDKTKKLNELLRIIADGFHYTIDSTEFRVDSVEINEIRLARKMGEELHNIDDGKFFNYKRLLEMARSIDPTLKNEELLNKYHIIFQQYTGGYYNPGGKNNPKEYKPSKIFPATFVMMKNRPMWVIKHEKTSESSNEINSIYKFLEDDVKDRRIDKVEQFMQIKKKIVGNHSRGERELVIQKEKEKQVGFWKLYSGILIPILALDKTEGIEERVILGFLDIEDIHNWDCKPISNESIKILQNIGNKLKGPISNAFLAHQWKIQNEKLKRAQQIIVEQEKQIVEESMAGGFAHEIRNALSPVVNYLALFLGIGGHPGLLDNTPLNDKDKENFAKFFNLIRNQIKYALSITNAIMNYARIENEKIYEPCNIKELVNDIVNMYSVDIKNKDVKLSTDIRYDGNVYTNPTQIKQVIVNIVSNALNALSKVNKEDRRLKISVEYMWQSDKYFRYADTVKIIVNDSGPGIPDDIKDKIFRPFFSTNPEKKAAGLGLATSRKIVKIYGGDIFFDSKPGDTSFYIYIPVGKEKYEGKQ